MAALSMIGWGSGLSGLVEELVSVLIDIVHRLFGVAGLAVARTICGARANFVGGGAVYFVLWIYGLPIEHDSGG